MARKKKVEAKKKSKWAAGETGVTYNGKHYAPGELVPFKDENEVAVHRDAGVAVLDAR